MALITLGMVHETGERKKCANVEMISLPKPLHSAIFIGDQYHVTTSFLVQTLTWTDLASREFECEKG